MKKLSNSKLIRYIAVRCVVKSNIIINYTKNENKGLFDLHFDNFIGYKCSKASFIKRNSIKENGAFRYVFELYKLSI